MIGLDDTLTCATGTIAGVDGQACDRVLVLGFGYLVMGDAGVGIHVLRQLEDELPVQGVKLLGVGTGGACLPTEIESASDIVLIRAARNGQPAGTITFLQLGVFGELPRGLGVDDFGLKDLFSTMARMNPPPRLHQYAVAVEELRPMCTELSPAVAAAVPEVVQSAYALATRLAAA